MKDIKIVGVWEMGWNTPIKEVELWQFPLKDFGVEKFYMSPISGILSDSVEEHSDLNQFLINERKLGRQIIFVDEKGEQDLTSFKHPANATYVFGRTSFSPMVAFKKPEDLSVKIKTINDSGLLWSHQAAAIVLYDKIIKG